MNPRIAMQWKPYKKSWFEFTLWKPTNWYVRVLGRGFSVQPVKHIWHKHGWTAGEYRTVHVAGLCWRLLK